MPTTLQSYRIFIASPGGLEAERKAFRTSIDDYNETDAVERGVLFRPVGWEQTLAGVGRPQELINEDLRKCDYLVLVLWDRWGSSPSTGQASKYTSGTDEEYNVALESLANPGAPMRQVVVLFKAVDERKLSDPGPQLQRVLEFRKTLETQKNLFFQTFDNITAFESALRLHLAKWVRDHEAGTTAQVVTPERADPTSGEPDSHSPGWTSTNTSDEFKRADELTSQGQITEAEAALASATVSGDNFAALWKYGEFLREERRYVQAETMITRLIVAAEAQGDSIWLINGLNSLAVVRQAQGDYAPVEGIYVKAIELAEQALGSNHSSVAALRSNLGTYYFSRGKFPEARIEYQLALRLQQQAYGTDSPLLAEVMYGLGNLYRALDQAKPAQDSFRRALAMWESSSGAESEFVAKALNGLAGVFLDTGKLDDAEALYRRALAIRRQKSETHIYVAYCLAGLGDVEAARQRLKRAEELYRRALDIKERHLGSDDPDIAKSLNDLGQTLRRLGRFQEAERTLRRSLSVCERSLGTYHPRMATTLANLAALYGDQGQYREADELYGKATHILETVIGTDHRRVADLLEQHAALLQQGEQEDRASGLGERARLIRASLAIPDVKE